MDTSCSESSDALLQEYAALEYILLGDLRDLLEEPTDDITCRWLTAVLDALLDTLPRQFDLEEDGGYLSEVVDAFPHWADEVERLQQDHSILFGMLKELRERVDQHSPFEDIANEVRISLQEWMRSLVAHNRHENRLVQTAINLEIGTGD